MVQAEKQPISFFEHLDEIKEKIKGKEIIFFLDYDGTLTPIVATPDLAIISEEMRQTVKELAGQFKTSIVSGRATSDVSKKAQIKGINYAGSHGFEIVGANGEVKINEEAQRIRPVIDTVHRELSERLSSVKGALVEHVKYTISTHYRLVAEKDVPEVEKAVDEALLKHPMLKKNHGKKVFELKPKLDWHKGKAVEWILSVTTSGGDNFLPIYIGDDTTDEDAFAVLEGKGFGILVAEVPRASLGTYMVKNPNEVKKALEFFINLKKG